MIVLAAILGCGIGITVTIAVVLYRQWISDQRAHAMFTSSALLKQIERARIIMSKLMMQQQVSTETDWGDYLNRSLLSMGDQESVAKWLTDTASTIAFKNNVVSNETGEQE